MQCTGGGVKTLINPTDKGGSQVTELQFQQVVANKLLHVIITVTNKNNGNEAERLETEVYLRNAT